MARLLSIFLCVLLLVAAPSLSQAQTKSAKGFVEDMLEGMLATEGRTVSLDGVSISFTGGVTVKTIDVKDGEQPWMTINGFSLDWQPLSLLSQSLKINAVSIDSIDLMRLPQTPEGTVSAPKEASELTAADIASIKIGKFKVGRAIAGEDVTFSVDGSGQIKASPAEISLNLKAERVDDKKGSLTAAILFDPNSRKIVADVGLHEPAGGLIASQLRLAGNPAVDLKLSANGTFDDWTGDFALDFDQQRIIGGKAQAATEASGMAITIDGTGKIATLMPSTLAGFFAGDSQLVAAVSLPHEGGRADVQRIRVDSAGFQLRAAGLLDWAGQGSDLSIELRSKDETTPIELPGTTGLGKVEIAGLSADLRLSGPAANPRWTFSAAAKSFTSDVMRLGEPGIEIAASGAMPSGAAVMLDGSINAAVGQGSRGVIPPAALGALRGQFGVTWRDDGSIEIRGVNLGAGALSFNAGGMANLLSGVFDVTVRGTAQSPETGYSLSDRLLQGPVRLEGRITGDDQGAIGLDGLHLTSRTADGRIEGKFDPATIALDIQANVNDLSVIDKGIGGKAHLRAVLNGPRKQVTTTIAADGESVTLLGQRFEQPRLRASMLLDGTAPAADLDFSGALSGKPVAISGKLETAADGTRRLRNLKARSGASEIAGDLLLTRANLPSGQLTFNAPDLEDVGPFLLMRLSGSASGRIDLSNANNVANLKADFQGRNINSDAVVAQTLNGNVTINDVLGQPRPQGQIAVTGARLGGLSFRSLDLNARATGGSSYAIAVKAAGDELSANGEANVTLQNGETTITVSTLAGQSRGLAFKAANGFTIRKRGEAISVANGAFTIGSGQATLDGQLLPQLNTRVALSNLPLSAFAKLTVPGLAGTLSGDAQLSGSLSAPNGRFNLAANGLTFQTLRDQGLKPISLKASGALSNGRVSVNGSGQAGQDLTASFDGSVGITAPNAIDLSVRGRAGNRLFADRLAEKGIRLTGNATYDLRIGGTIGAPKFDGSIALAGATFGDAQGRFIIRNTTGRATIAGNVIRIEQLSGTTGKNGTASITGSVTLDGGPSLDIRARIENGVYVDGTLVSTRYDADLILRGSFAGTPTLTGGVDLEKTKITLSELPPSALKPLDVKHVKAPLKVKQQIKVLRERGGGGAVDIALDINLRAADPISISGRGLTAVLGGRLKITGMLGEPQASGAFVLQRGSLKLVARRLEFESGRLDFDRDLDPKINLVAVSRRTDATITLTISGYATTPQIAVTATPRMPQEEALARLIFDRSMLQLSPLQLAQIAGSIATLTGGGGSNILTKFQDALGVDWIEVTETETGQTAIGIGKRVNDRLSVGVEQTTKGNTSRVTIDLNLTGNLKARGALGTDGSSRAGVVYEKDY